jgi:hypothetical protein
MINRWRTWLVIVLFVVAAYCNTPLLSQPYVAAQPPDTGPYTLHMTLGRGMVRSVAWSPDGSVIAVGGALGIWLYTLDLDDIGLLRAYQPSTDRFQPGWKRP